MGHNQSLIVKRRKRHSYLQETVIHLIHIVSTSRYSVHQIMLSGYKLKGELRLNQYRLEHYVLPPNLR